MDKNHKIRANPNLNLHKTKNSKINRKKNSWRVIMKKILKIIRNISSKKEKRKK